MTLDAAWLFAFFLVFARCSAMLLTAPLFGANAPPMLRVFASASVAIALTPVIQPHLGAAPETLDVLVFALGREVCIGLLLGMCLHLVAYAAQMAGAFLDMNMGVGAAQIFNPALGTQASVLAQVKYLLVVVVMLGINAHHLLLAAFASSYSAAGLTMEHMPSLLAGVVGLVTSATALAAQIAAPTVAVTFVVDVVAGVIGRAVPQMQVFFLTIPAKVMLGMLAVGIGLPLMTNLVQGAVERTFAGVARAFGGG